MQQQYVNEHKDLLHSRVLSFAMSLEHLGLKSLGRTPFLSLPEAFQRCLISLLLSHI